jgi:protease-4
VRLGEARVGLARAEEVGAVLSALGAKVPVYCHADELSNATLYLAAAGCKQVWLSPAGGVEALGIAAQTVYFHKLLAEELGLDVDFLQVGKYKGAEEPFTRDGPSPEARASLESALGDIRRAWLEGIRKGRPGMAEGAPEDGPFAPATAKERGLIDQIGYYDEARDALEKATGAVRAEARLGGAGSEKGDLGDVLRLLAGDSLGAAPVAVVRASGTISMEGSGGLGGGGGGISERRLVRTLTRLAKDDDVKAVVFRIDSPGGSALASDLLWHAMMSVRERKPLVVSVGGMAASGGMYLASAGTLVFADEVSILGSIGVVGGKIAANRALEKVGVHAETIPARAGDPHAAARAGAESLLEPWDEPTRARLLETMESVYRLFVSRVSEGRKIPEDKVVASAEGRLFGGSQSKERGLVDEIGGLKQALSRARTLAGLGPDARFAVVEDHTGLLDALGGDGPEDRSRAGAFPSATLPGSWGLATGVDGEEVAGVVAALRPIFVPGASERVLCLLPFALTVH